MLPIRAGLILREGKIMYMILAVLLVFLGAFMVFRPQLAYALLESWKHEGGGEPSKFYLLNIRTEGSIFMIIGIIGAAVLMFL